MRSGLAVLLALALAAGQTAAGAPPPPAEIADAPVGLLVDVNSGRTLHACQPDLRFTPAAMAKVMTAYVAFEEMDKGLAGLFS